MALSLQLLWDAALVSGGLNISPFLTLDSPLLRRHRLEFLFVSLNSPVSRRLAILTFSNSRFAYYEDGTCRIGMKRIAMIPLIAFDILVNVRLSQSHCKHLLTETGVLDIIILDSSAR